MSNRLSDVTEEQWQEVNKDNRDIVDEFLSQSKHLSPQSLKQYRSALRLFFRWVKDESSNKPLYKLSPRDALRYQNYLYDLELSSSGIKFKRASVSSLCGYVENFLVGEVEEYEKFRNIFNKKVPTPPKNPKHKKEPLNPEEWATVLAEMELRGKWMIIAWLKFTYASGCRRAESMQLLKEVVTYDKMRDSKTGEEKTYYHTHDVRCKGRGKMGKIRPLRFDDDAKAAIKKWLDIRGNDDCPYVFASFNKETGQWHQVSETTFNYWCSKIFTPIVGRRVHPHQIRAQRATHLVEYEGKDIKVAQALLGHESSTTTEMYVIRNTTNDVDGAFGE